MFYNELDMLWARLNILADAVDFHVVCEGTLTHSGKPKPLYYEENAARFAPFADKIIHVVADLDNAAHAWERERRQRQAIRFGLLGIAPDDLVIVGDCDEIPNPDVIAQIGDQGAELELDMYYYNLNTRVGQGWSIGALRWGDGHDPNAIRALTAGQPPRITNAGWHLSYFGGAHAIAEKVQAFMHYDWLEVTPQAANVDNVAAKIVAGMDVWERDTHFTHVPTGDHLPRYILDHADEFAGWFA